MEELVRPEPVDVEQLFNQFVIDVGGQLVTSYFPNQITTHNADYFFESSNVIGELKCFQKDLFNNDEDVSRFVDYLEQWTEKGLIEEGDVLKIIFGTKKMPKECWDDLISSASKTIERAIHKGNKQIKATKKLLNKPDAKGLLFLCNDGNYFIENRMFLYLICNIMGRKYMDSDIDGFVYFTCNQASTMPNSDLDWTLWAPSYRDENDNHLSDFVNQLGSKFYDYYYKSKGKSETVYNKIDNREQGIKIIGDMKYIPKEIIYKKKK